MQAEPGKPSFRGHMFTESERPVQARHDMVPVRQGKAAIALLQVDQEDGTAGFGAQRQGQRFRNDFLGNVLGERSERYHLLNPLGVVRRP